MGHWTHSRVGGGQWQRIWVSDAEEAKEKERGEELERMIEDAYTNINVRGKD